MADFASKQLTKLFRGAQHEQVEVLRELVVDLLIEVEALRALHISSPADVVARYRHAYEATVLESHNSAGPFSGYERVLWAWYGTTPAPETAFEGLTEGTRREVHLLRRLGASEAEIDQHLLRAEEHATRT